MKNIAVILSGCGFLDGAEIRESVLTFLVLDELKAMGHNFKVHSFAPDALQHHVLDHCSQDQKSSEKRNMLVEAARITRGDISPLSSFQSNLYDGVIFPGGFGVAKNFCSFAFEGAAGNVREDISTIIRRMHQEKRPIIAICIAPALIAMVLGKEYQIEVTIGEDKQTAAEIQKSGAKHMNCKVNEFHFDSKNLVYSTPGYMFDSATLDQIHQGIQEMLKHFLQSIK